MMLESFLEDTLNGPGSSTETELQIGKDYFPVISEDCVAVPKNKHLPACQLGFCESLRQDKGEMEV